MTDLRSPRFLRRAYLEWIEEQVEAYKDSIPRGELLALAEEVVEKLRVSPRGQYQLTEILLCEAVDRHIIRLLRLPSYRAWKAKHPRTPPPPEVIPIEVLPVRPPAPEEEEEPVAEASVA